MALNFFDELDEVAAVNVEVPIEAIAWLRRAPRISLGKP
jgi:hypothetical protein